mmetsp:Transcript_498/g.93  ORF Transcript_498/g.93 Transcript_498/m.93 type:complete len:105 (+) Transcript_498:40-354(+)
MSAFSHLCSGMMNNLFMTWILLFIGPVVFLVATMFARGIEFLYKEARLPYSTISNYLGNVTWLFPLSSKERTFNLTHIGLLSVYLLILGLIVVSSMKWSKIINE